MANSNFQVRPISDPAPVWDLIKHRLSDDGGELCTKAGFYVGVFDGDMMAGAFLLQPWNDHCYEIHGGVHPAYWGRGVGICRTMGLAVFASTPCLKIVAVIPEFNNLMRRCVQRIGLKQEGIITKSFLKWTRLYDQYVYGISKREVELCRQ